MVVKEYCQVFDYEDRAEDIKAFENGLTQIASDLGKVKEEKVLEEIDLIEYLNMAAIDHGFEGCAFCKLEVKEYPEDPENPTIKVYGDPSAIKDLEAELEGNAEVTEFKYKDQLGSEEEAAKITFAWYDMTWYLRSIILNCLKYTLENLEEEWDDLPYKSRYRLREENNSLRAFEKKVGMEKIRKMAKAEHSVMKPKIWIRVNGHKNMVRFCEEYQDIIQEVVGYGRKNSGRYKVRVAGKHE